MDWAKLHRDVVFGQSGGKIIWQPRISCWYYDKLFAGEALPAPYTGLSLPEIYRSLNCSARLYQYYNPCFQRIEDPAVHISEKKLNETDTQITIQTPAGNQIAINRRTSASPRQIHVKWEIESPAELKAAVWREEHATWRWDAPRFKQANREVGDLGAPTIFLPRMNIQDLYINKMGVERGVFALYDWPDMVETYFRALEENQARLIDLVNASPIHIVNFGENVHAGTLAPELFRKYHLPECRRRCKRLHAAGKFVSAHWDGDCAPLLPYAHETGLDGIEAITPKPQGDVTLDQVKQALGDDLFLLDGIPAILFDEMYPIAQLTACARRLIELFAPNLVLGISDEISSTGDIERVRIVGKIVDAYNAQF